MSDQFRTLIVTAADAPLAREIAAAFGPGGVGMWTTPLSTSGQNPATHYVSSGFVPEQFAAMAPLQVYEWVQPIDSPTGSWQLVSSDPGNPVAVYEAVKDTVECTLADIEVVFNNADVTEQEPFTAFGRLGLQIINPPISE